MKVEHKKIIVISVIIVVLCLLVGIVLYVSANSGVDKTSNKNTENETDSDLSETELASGNKDTEDNSTGTESTENSTQNLDGTDASEIVDNSSDESKDEDSEPEKVEPSETETVESSEEESEEPSEEPSESEKPSEGGKPSEEPSESEKPSEEPSESEKEEPAKPTYTYTDMNKTMYAKSSVNVRDLPSTDGKKLGSLSEKQEVVVTGKCNETGWYRITFNGKVGYVSSSYLTSEKPVEKPAEKPTDNPNNGNSESDEVTNSKEDISAGAKMAIEAGYYKVVANPDTGGYTVLVKDNNDEEFNKGYSVLEEYLHSIGYSPSFTYGGWVSYNNKDYFIISCTEVKTWIDSSDPANRW